MASNAQLTPMMAQYRRIKSELPKDALLLFRLGDFYEMFFEDAQTGAQLLNVALTKRGVIPMCGIPFHAANAYIGRLLRAGRKVAICDQMEEARPGQLVKREVTQILSPGTHFDERMLKAERNNFLGAVYPAGRTYGLAFVDLTTGDFHDHGSGRGHGGADRAAAAAAGGAGLPGRSGGAEGFAAGRQRRAARSRLPLPVGLRTDKGAGETHSATGFGWILNGYDDWVFAPETALFTVREHFKVASLDGFGLKDRTAAIGAAGAVLHYLTQHLRRDVANLTRISFYQRSDYLALDFTTLRHLEMLEPLHHDAPRNASLYGALNRTVTPMGARRLRDWLSQPLATVEPIRRRQEAVQTFVGQRRRTGGAPGTACAGAGSRTHARAAERGDRERAGPARAAPGAGADSRAEDDAARVGGGRSKCGMRSAECGIGSEPPYVGCYGEGSATRRKTSPTLLEELEGRVTELPDLVELIGRAIVDEPPLAVKEGGLIRDGFDAALDELRTAMRGGKDWIAKLQQDEIARTGIQSLKVRFNSVFGYYIEVTRANLDKVPPDYIRKQTIANGERFITPELKEMEGKILGAEERSVKLEYELFQRVREAVLERLAEIQQTAAALAQLDVLGSFAETARLYNYCRPRDRQRGQPLHPRGPPPGAGAEPERGALRAQRRAPGRRDANRAHHRAEHGGQEHLHPPGGAARRCWRTPGRSSRRRKRALTWWTASSPASAPATTWRAASPRSWSRCARRRTS